MDERVNAPEDLTKVGGGEVFHHGDFEVGAVRLVVFLQLLRRRGSRRPVQNESVSGE